MTTATIAAPELRPAGQRFATTATGLAIGRSHLRTLAAADRLIAGTADEEDFDIVGMQVNICKVRAMDIDLSLIEDFFDPATDAMLRARDRAQRTGRLALDGPGIQAVRDVLQPLQEIIDHSSPLQMRNARRVVIDTITGRKGSWREYERWNEQQRAKEAA